MKQLIMKARSGVTLVELLVVILIVTILSVSMLPLLQPFVTEAQYAAEAIPVIGNLRTKIGVYQYDKGHVPESGTNGVDWVQTWRMTDGDSEKFEPASYTLGGLGQPVTALDVTYHIQRHIDVDYQDLKGKRSKPIDYHYYSIRGTSNTCYVVGCFGSGNGLKAGTGYAVCELNYPALGKKYIGTFKCYKPVNENTPMQFVSGFANAWDSNVGRPVACYVPTSEEFITDSVDEQTHRPSQIGTMEAAGWEF